MKYSISSGTTLGRIYWPLVAVLTALNTSIVFLGFHPHHDGLMLSTIRLVHHNLLNGGGYPFNQYGSFWTIPYLLISFISPPSVLLVSMRILTFLLYSITGVLTYKIADKYFNSYAAKIALLLIILIHPIGLEPIPWPSSVSMFLTALLAYLVLGRKVRHSGIDSKISFSLAGAVAVMNILCRVQVGILALVAVLIFLGVAKGKFLLHFISGAVGFATFYSLLLQSQGWLGDSLRDEFLFGWNVASSSLTDRTFPKLSLLVLVFFILSSIIHRVLVHTPFMERKILVSLIYLFFGLICFAKLLIGDFSALIGKIWVAIALYGCLVSIQLILQRFKRREFEVALLAFLGIAAASQIYPLFDIMHTWWGITPIVIVLAHLAERFISLHKLQRHVIGPVIGICVILMSSQVNAIFSASEELSRTDLRLIHLDSTSHDDYVNQDNFFLEHINSGSSVLNVCSDARIFFKPNYVQSETRYFVYWPIMDQISKIRHTVLRSDPDFILFCSNNGFNKTNPVVKKFTTAPYSLVGKYSSNDLGMQIWKRS